VLEKARMAAGKMSGPSARRKRDRKGEDKKAEEDVVQGGTVDFRPSVHAVGA
jgi:hypothetical protein